MSKDDKPSAEALAGRIADVLRDAPEAEKAFRANPVKFLEEQLGQPLPAGLRVEIHDNTDKVWHIPVGGSPCPVGEAQLNAVSGGGGSWGSEADRQEILRRWREKGWI